MQDFSHFLQTSQKNSHTRQFQIQPHHIQFQTNDSEASNTSYQSSLSSNEENNLGNAEYFRQQMSRFFINYPQLLNEKLVGEKTNQKSLWGELASDLIKQAKQEPISLQGIAKRIAFYREKTQEIDMIDLIVKQKDLILKQLDEQAKMGSQQNLNAKTQQSDKRISVIGQNTQNTYFSWKKRHQINLINDSRKNNARKLHSASVSSQNGQASNSGRFGGSAGKFNTTKYTKNPSAESSYLQLKKNSSSTNGNNPSQERRKDGKKITYSKKQETPFQNLQNKPSANGQSVFLKNILKFEPKTQAAKQLLQQIKKHHPNDTISIKKTIVNFLYRHRQTMKKNILSKSCISERLSKLHIQDSKQLLLFCPIKKMSGETQMPLTTETNSFLQILNQISTGHLMKYWKLLQQRKL